jgi:hypothetical protein
MAKLNTSIAAAALAAALSFAGLMPAVAQTTSSPLAEPGGVTLPQPRYAHRRIEIYPGRLLYRRCIDWYELQHRPSGTVLYPQMRCWWVRG